ncbi:hypothetical protein AHIS1_p052 [Acaryochloris phage A-HIS1]|nr:hypothetical protein AHIS1_p052 [Acaryochloris phage A-HIS1]
MLSERIRQRLSESSFYGPITTEEFSEIIFTDALETALKEIGLETVLSLIKNNEEAKRQAKDSPVINGHDCMNHIHWAGASLFTKNHPML